MFYLEDELDKLLDTVVHHIETSFDRLKDTAIYYKSFLANFGNSSGKLSSLLPQQIELFRKDCEQFQATNLNFKLQQLIDVSKEMANKCWKTLIFPIVDSDLNFQSFRSQKESLNFNTDNKFTVHNNKEIVISPGTWLTPVRLLETRKYKKSYSLAENRKIHSNPNFSNSGESIFFSQIQNDVFLWKADYKSFYFYNAAKNHTVRSNLSNFTVFNLVPAQKDSSRYWLVSVMNNRSNYLSVSNYDVLVWDMLKDRPSSNSGYLNASRDVLTIRLDALNIAVYPKPTLAILMGDQSISYWARGSREAFDLVSDEVLMGSLENKYKGIYLAGETTLVIVKTIIHPSPIHYVDSSFSEDTIEMRKITVEKSKSGQYSMTQEASEVLDLIGFIKERNNFNWLNERISINQVIVACQATKLVVSYENGFVFAISLIGDTYKKFGGIKVYCLNSDEVQINDLLLVREAGWDNFSMVNAGGLGIQIIDYNDGFLKPIPKGYYEEHIEEEIEYYYDETLPKPFRFNPFNHENLRIEDAVISNLHNKGLVIQKRNGKLVLVVVKHEYDEVKDIILYDLGSL